MARKQGPSQLMELLFAVAEQLGITSDKDIAALADIGVENLANWRSGAVKEMKATKFQTARDNLIASLQALRAQAGVSRVPGLDPLEIEAGSSPADLQRQFRHRIVYDYLGHRFLYFEPQGALAWENLIKAGYEQDHWLEGVRAGAAMWLDTKRDGEGQIKGPIARALRPGRRDRPRGLDVISLGPGEGGKEVRLLRELEALEDSDSRWRLQWLGFAPVDVSIALLLTAADAGRKVFDDHDDRASRRSVLPFCADFEEGNLIFAERLRTSKPVGEDGLRLIVILGNVLGNLRNEERFVREKLHKLARPGDLVWIEVGLRPEPLDRDPLFALTETDRAETASEANRRLLLEGPYRRWAAAIGRPTPNLSMRVWVREDDESARVPGSCNFCHDLIIRDEGSRVCTMLYSRRYKLEEMTAWFEALDFDVQGIHRVHDSKGRERVGHLLLRRRG
jgi:hypothetical protein